MFRIKIVKEGKTTYYRGPNQTVDQDILAKPYPNQAIVETGIKLIQKDQPELVKGAEISFEPWSE